ncbi:MAG: hypothetical protein R2711_15540 [Acidimicrobiales bacterium]
MALDLPVRHDDVLVTLLGKALALLPRDQAEAMAEEVGREYGRTMAAAMGEASDVQRSFRTVPTPWPTPSPPTASLPTPSSTAASCGSRRTTAPSAMPPSSTP